MLRNADQVGGGVPHRIVLDRPIEPDHHEQPADDAVEASLNQEGADRDKDQRHHKPRADRKEAMTEPVCRGKRAVADRLHR